jgi:hypothetical protein
MAEPSAKSRAVESVLLGLIGADRRDSIRADICLPPPIGCGGPASQFNDDCSRREFAISGLCQKCQDSLFGS